MGPVTLLTQTSAQDNRNLFYLLPGAGQQARALVNFAAKKPELKKSRLAIVYSENELALAAAARSRIRPVSSAGLPSLRKPFQAQFRCGGDSHGAESRRR